MLRLKIAGFVVTNTAKDVLTSHPKKLAFCCRKHSWNLLYKYISGASSQKRLDAVVNGFAAFLPSVKIMRHVL